MREHAPRNDSALLQLDTASLYLAVMYNIRLQMESPFITCPILFPIEGKRMKRQAGYKVLMKSCRPETLWKWI